VLLVDDSAKVRRTIISLLSDLPEIEIVGEAQDGLEAIDAAAKLSPDLVILDLRMPRLNGFEVLKALKKEQRDCIVIVFSAMADDACRQTCLELGARHFFDKVTQFDEFLPAVKALQSE
jgi:DNA-binding NarL/FixJ family response regulator